MKNENNLTKTHILAVDDDQEIRTLLAEILGKYGYQVSIAANGQQMQAILDQQQVHLVILDVMMPGDDGIALCKKLRQQSNLPIIMLSAMSEDSDKIIGLEVGADDYLPKPFNPRELVARIKAVLRRPQAEQEDENYNAIRFDKWTLLIHKRHLLSPDNVEVPLSTSEFDLLSIFLNHSQHVLSRDQLLEYTKHRQSGPFDRSIDMQVSRLRQKIEQDPKQPQLIKTIRCGGYMFSSQVEKLLCP